MKHFRRASRVASVELDGELMLMEPTGGQYFGLDAIGARVWELLQEPTTLEGLVETLLTEFDVSAEICRADLSELLERMNARLLVETS